MTPGKDVHEGKDLFVGIDVGSVSVKVVLLDAQQNILERHYVRSKGQPMETILRILRDVGSRHPLDFMAQLAITGSGGKLAAQLLGGALVNEIVAQTKAVGRFHPQVRTVIEIGGEDSKLMMLRPDPRGEGVTLEDFSMNTMCAAGTGSFLDQQASRLGLTIEEFARLALKAETPPRMAGRCSVFAKSDMIHLQQIGTPDYDIAAGLCYAVARSFKSNIGRGKIFVQPIAFQGGVAANPGLVRAFEDILSLNSGDLIIPEHFAFMGALGAIYITLEGDGERKGNGFRGLKHMEESLKAPSTPVQGLKALHLDYEVENEKRIAAKSVRLDPSDERVDVYLGVDVGSLSTNVVAIDRERRVLARRYLRTAGRPIEAVRRGLLEIGGEIADQVRVCGVGTTGSGRYLTGDFVGADVVRNEITAQATAAIDIDPRVDTVFEIGGQDSKYISIDDEAVVDFAMNKVCAAGTGSFLEEQAEKLGINIVEEFGNLALISGNPGKFGDRCTVFMESDLVSHQQQGVPKEDLVAGLAYSIVHNYLNKVVEDRRVGDNIFFQGGTAWNQGVVAAFEKVTGKKITVPPHHDVTGAIGAAILAMEADEGKGSSFKGFDLRHRTHNSTPFTCKGCENMCEIRKITFGEDKPLFYGARCERYEVDDHKKHRGAQLPELFKERENFLMADLLSRGQEEKTEDLQNKIGIPRVLHFHELLPFWSAFFHHLGFEVVLSEVTNPQLIYRSVENVVAETCFPVKVVHGHILDLVNKGVGRIFLPSIINMPRIHSDHTENYLCPLSQAIPYISRSAISFKEAQIEFLEPYFHFQHHRRQLLQEIVRFGRSLGKSEEAIRGAFAAAQEAQATFERRCQERGEEILANLSDYPRAVVIISRSYNGCDPGLNLGLPKKLRDMGVLAIPMDFLPLEREEILASLATMYWKSGQRILAAAELIKQIPQLHAIFITNFKCGPDSFIAHFLRARMTGKPYLQLEVDEHSADAGVITRCEAFFDSLERKPGLVQNGTQMASTTRGRELHSGEPELNASIN
jgi:predicted CoA-substrate-specific enzyme activase